ncbi:MAG: hypothetical protein ACRD7E_21950 [Bryobacteraceae bacterium]
MSSSEFDTASKDNTHLLRRQAARIMASALVGALAILQAEPVKEAPRTIVRVPVSVVLQDDSPALKPSDFSARVGNEEAKVVRVRSPKSDLLLLVVFDVSGDLALVGPAKQSLVDRLKELSSKTYIALLRAQNGLQVLRDPSNKREDLAEAIQSVAVSGKAGMLDTVETACRLADSIAARSGVRAAVLYVTDSDVRNYREDFTNPVINSSDLRDLSRRFPEGLVREKISKLEDTLTGLQSPLFFVHLDYRTDRLNEAYQTGLMQLATATGGAGIFCRSQGEIPDAIRHAMSSVSSQYVVSVELPGKASRLVSVQLESGDRAVAYRSRFRFR